MELVTLADIQAARVRIKQHVLHTPNIRVRGTNVWLKAESLQSTGSFKLRGAVNKVAMLDESARARGVVADSSGNHAQAVAVAAKIFGTRATIVMPYNAPPIKVEATRYFGADIVFTENSTDSLEATARELERTHGFARIPPYDDPAIIAATGTIALELLEDRPDLRAVTVPISGGGLIAGIATAIKLTRPDVRVIGVEPALACDAYDSFKAGHVVALSAEQMNRTIADGLRVRHVGDLTWKHIQQYVDDVVTVTEAQILAAMARIASHARLVAEPSGAVPVAAWFADDLAIQGQVAAILCGGNVDPRLLARALNADDLN